MKVTWAVTFTLLLAVHSYRIDIDGASGNCSDGKCEDDDDDAPCPPDSIIDPGDGSCVCSPSHCVQTVCKPPTHTVLHRKGTDVPGDCCDVYECVLTKVKNCSEVICPKDNETCPADSYSLPAVISQGDCCSVPQGCQCLPRKCQEVICEPGQHQTIVRPGNQQPGSCCPLVACVNATDSCIHENKHHENNTSWFSANNSALCNCTKGFVFCTDPPATTEPDGCVSNNGLIYKNNDVWDETECTSCRCVNGKKSCQAYACEIKCINPVHEPGECCPVCNESSVVNLPSYCPSLRNCSLRCLKGFVRDEYNCFKCQCQSEPCLLECENGFVQNERGHGLCECAAEPTIITDLEPITCQTLTNCKKNCSLGYKINKYGCQICKCDVCNSMSGCKKLCLYGFAANEIGCPICKCLDAPSTAVVEVTTSTSTDKHSSCYSSQGQVHEDGELWHDGCRQCYCHAGTEMCNMIRCPKLNCTNPLFVSASDCCPACSESGESNRSIVSSSILCHSEDGLYRAEGETWKIGTCTQCLCHQGQVLCETRQCPPTPCPQPVYNDKSCCPTCPQSTSMEETNGKSCSFSHEHGTTWRDGNCRSCKCDNGQAICYSEPCHHNTCHHPVLLKNHCCSLCLEKSSEEPCVISNITYQHGEKGIDDVCRRCECSNGNTICSDTTCSSMCDIVTDRCCHLCSGVSGQVSNMGISIYIIGFAVLTVIVGTVIVFIMVQCKKEKKCTAYSSKYSTLPLAPKMPCKEVKFDPIHKTDSNGFAKV